MTTGLLGRVPSLTTPDTSYEIAFGRDGLSCSCPAFTYGKKKGKPCKHLDIWRAVQTAQERCANAHRGGGEAPGICERCLIALIAAATGKVRKDYLPKQKRSKKEMK